jgi:hypothetical protein
VLATSAARVRREPADAHGDSASRWVEYPLCVQEQAAIAQSKTTRLTQAGNVVTTARGATELNAGAAEAPNGEVYSNETKILADTWSH